MGHHDEEQDNKKATPTSNIAPGTPLWYESGDGVHHQKDFGPGYDQHDPVGLHKGHFDKGNAITRFGKFSFKQTMSVTPTEHGEVIDLPILRTEGAKGRWTVVISADPTRSTGVLGKYQTAVEHGYDVCRVDLDLYSLNKDMPGVDWSSITKELSVTFEAGEVEKNLKAIIPYRTAVRTLLPDIVRNKITYHVGEFQKLKYMAYLGRSGGWAGWSYTPYHRWCGSNNRTGTRPGEDMGGIQCSKDNQYMDDVYNRWIWYNVYTLPMPRTYIENLIGNQVYLDSWDRNYRERLQKNTERDKVIPNRKDDNTAPDVETDGHVTRYDHAGKIELVSGVSRFTRFHHRLGKGHQPRSCPCYIMWPNTKIWISNDYRITHRVYPKYPNAILMQTEWHVDYPASVFPIETFGAEYWNNQTSGPNRDGSGRNYYSWSWSSMGVDWDGIHSQMYFANTGHYNDWIALGGGIQPGSRYGPKAQVESVDNWAKRGEKRVLEWLPMPHTNWVREDYPEDPMFKHMQDTANTVYPSWDGAIQQSSSATAKNIHPRFHFYDTGLFPVFGKSGNAHRRNDNSIQTKTVKPSDCSIYESIRYKLGDDPNDLWLLPSSDLGPNPLPAGTRDFHFGSVPEDRVFNYGNKTTGIGDLAQVMFNHQGCKVDEFVTGTTKGGKGDTTWSANMLSGAPTQYFVMKHEDPSFLKRVYDTPNVDAGFVTRWGAKNTNQWNHHHHSGRHCWSAGMRQTVYGPHPGSVTGSYCHEIGDYTDDWLIHDPSLAGRLDALDSPKTASNGSEYYPGYRWDGTSVETVSGSIKATTGLGSPGHGEQGTSRILYDFRGLTHPLSSHEKNEQNLKGYYKGCTDHNMRYVFLKLNRRDPSDPTEIGMDEIKMIVDHTTDYSPTRQTSYDHTARPDHQIDPGLTFQTGDLYDGAPTAPSVTERLFTPIGGQTTDPVLFLALSAGVDPGQTPESPETPPPTRPGKLRNAPLVVNQTTTSSTLPVTFDRTFSNVGERALTIKLPTILSPIQTSSSPGTVGYLGHDPSLWSWSYVDATGNVLAVNSMPPNPSGVGPSGLFNTVTLSAGEEVAVQYNLATRSNKTVEVQTGIDGNGDPITQVQNQPADQNYVKHDITVEIDGVDKVVTYKYEVNHT